MIEPFLFDELADNPIIELPPEIEIKSYNTPIEQATLDIMEEVDIFFRSSVTVDEYDAVQKKIKKILTEAFDEKKEIPGKQMLVSHPK